MVLAALMMSGCWESFSLATHFKIKNASNREIYVYSKASYPDTILSAKDLQTIAGTIKRDDVGISPFLNAVKPYAWDFIGVYGYGDKKSWQELLSKDTLMLFIFDKQRLLQSNNPISSKIKIIYLDVEKANVSDTVIFSQ
jgi:hypothetical protein